MSSHAMQSGEFGLVQFRTSSGLCGVPVDQTVVLRRAADIVPLPSPRDGVLGFVSHDGMTVPVVSRLSRGGDQLLVLAPTDRARFALLVDEVIGVCRVRAGDVKPPPPGQADMILNGTIVVDQHLVLLVDVDELARSIS